MYNWTRYVVDSFPRFKKDDGKVSVSVLTNK